MSTDAINYTNYLIKCIINIKYLTTYSLDWTFKIKILVDGSV